MYIHTLDIMIVHGVSFTLLNKSVGRVVEFVSNCKEIDIYFPYYKYQEVILTDSKKLVGHILAMLLVPFIEY